MNIKNSVVVTAIAFLFLTGTAMAESQNSQVPESTHFLQSEEYEEFAAYEFEDSSENTDAATITNKQADNEDGANEMIPELWTDIP